MKLNEKLKKIILNSNPFCRFCRKDGTYEKSVRIVNDNTCLCNKCFEVFISHPRIQSLILVEKEKRRSK